MSWHLQLHLHLFTVMTVVGGMRTRAFLVLYLNVWNMSVRSKGIIRAHLDLCWEKDGERDRERGAASTGSLFQFWENSWHTFPSKGHLCQFNNFSYFGSHFIKIPVVLGQQYFPLDRGFAAVFNFTSFFLVKDLVGNLPSGDVFLCEELWSFLGIQNCLIFICTNAQALNW